MSQHSAACCSVPPVVSHGYQPKGGYINAGGLSTYKTGPDNAQRAILVIYDIFGFFPQTIQGADILATGDQQKPHLVFMPDLFEGKPADIAWYPPQTPEHHQNLRNFFATTAEPTATAARVPGVVQALQSQYPHIQSWGIVGYCWGGKIVNLSSRAGTPFRAAAACHPAMVDPSDAPHVAIPIAMLPSKDEDRNAVTNYQSGLRVSHLIEWFPTQIHGWMAARGDLSQPSVKAEYERGYKVLLDFFHLYL